jgi:hypothetical protein
MLFRGGRSFFTSRKPIRSVRACAEADLGTPLSRSPNSLTAACDYKRTGVSAHP